MCGLNNNNKMVINLKRSNSQQQQKFVFLWYLESEANESTNAVTFIEH